VPNALDGSGKVGGTAAWRRLLIGAGVAVGVLFGILAAFMAMSGVTPVDRPARPPQAIEDGSR
jgi:hypothetical protein